MVVAWVDQLYQMISDSMMGRWADMRQDAKLWFGNVWYLVWLIGSFDECLFQCGSVGDVHKTC